MCLSGTTYSYFSVLHKIRALFLHSYITPNGGYHCSFGIFLHQILEILRAQWLTGCRGQTKRARKTLPGPFFLIPLSWIRLRRGLVEKGEMPRSYLDNQYHPLGGPSRAGCPLRCYERILDGIISRQTQSKQKMRWLRRGGWSLASLATEPFLQGNDRI